MYSNSNSVLSTLSVYTLHSHCTASAIGTNSTNITTAISATSTTTTPPSSNSLVLLLDLVASSELRGELVVLLLVLY